MSIERILIPIPEVERGYKMSRVSTPEQGTHKQQIAKCKKLIAEQGWKDVGTSNEITESGSKPIELRKKFNAELERAYKCKPTRLVFSNLSRFGREIGDGGDLINELQRRGIMIASATEGIFYEKTADGKSYILSHSTVRDSRIFFTQPSMRTLRGLPPAIREASIAASAEIGPFHYQRAICMRCCR